MYSIPDSGVVDPEEPRSQSFRSSFYVAKNWSGETGNKAGSKILAGLDLDIAHKRLLNNCNVIHTCSLIPRLHCPASFLEEKKWACVFPKGQWSLGTRLGKECIGMHSHKVV